MERTKEIYKVTIVGSLVNVLLLVFKFVAGVLGHSSAMIADAVHSLSDFITDIVVLVFVKISGKPEDKSHEYGHGKYETLAMTVIGLVLVVVALGIISDGVVKIDDFFDGQALEAPGMLALWAAVTSIVLKEAVYRYSIIKARKLQSQALEANAWHHRSDALSSIGTLIGIGGAIFLGNKWVILDPIASVIVGIFLGKVAFGLLKEGVGDLTDTALPESVEQEIIQMVSEVENVGNPHNLKTRRIGNHYAIELHIKMDGDLTLRESHDKATEIENLLRSKYGNETHVGVHVEPFDE
ncbi:MAG: cation transporter [Bacteroidales bacterium]|nr:cation transporter [Bacteroidales bacterium]